MALGSIDQAALPRRIALGVPLALLGGAYLSQYGFGLAPCEMCWWQRYAHFAAIAFAVLAFTAKGQRSLVWLAISWVAYRQVCRHVVAHAPGA